MFAFIEGLLDYIDDDFCVIDAGGFGLNVFISAKTAMNLPEIGEHIKLFTYTSVREDGIALYGFDSRDDLAVYRKLISVSGVGPKVGLGILSVMDSDSLRLAICSEDIKALSKAPGVGNKLAQRIVLELKDKVKMSDGELGAKLFASSSASAVSNDRKLTDEMNDAISALIALGYGPTDAKKAILSIDNVSDMESGDILSAALKKLY